MLRTRPIVAVAGFAILSALLLAVCLAPPQAHAGGGIGSGGTPTGGGSSGDYPATVNGFGWYQLTVDSPVYPGKFTDNSTWASSGANDRCKAAGAKSIVAYLVFRPTGGINNSAVYSYNGWWQDTWAGGVSEPGHQRGSPWMTVASAKAKYDSVKISKAGFTWGSNVGWFCYNFSNNWNISGNSYIQVGSVPNKARATRGPVTAAPGDKLNWYHDLRNLGPDAMDKQTHYQIDKAGFSNGWNTIKTPTAWASGASGSLFVRIYAPGSPYATYVVTSGDVGHTLCQRISWSPNSDGGGAGASSYACASVPYNYTLTPYISTSPSLIREGDGNIAISATVKNSGGTTSVNTNWSVTRFILAPGSNYKKSGTANPPCTQFSGYVAGSCSALSKGLRTFPLGNTLVASFTDNLASVPPPGSEVCYVTSVDKGSIASPTWKHSSVSCSVVQRVPFVQVLGNDLRVGSAFSGANLTSGATGFVFNNAASWVEYGILAPGNISDIASESGANGGNAGAQSSWSKLTFANAGTPASCSSGYGCFTGASNMGKIPSVSAFVKTAQYNGAALNYDKGSASFSASSIPSFVPGANLDNFSQSASITTTGTITIDKDITYNPSSLHSANDIPQLILIANNINITGNVKHIDAWLIATGTINTCSDVVQLALRSSNCSNQMAINGAIMANQLLLDRTYYSSSTPAQAAESLNLRGDSYVWASNVARQSGQWQTVYSTDLPPRY